jgi:glycosyltransferase involved in cell wall biosynthesis
MPTIAVLMATYNGEKYIEEQLATIQNQTRKADYIVISDDGSTDRTFEILQEFAAASATPVLLLKNEKRLGYSDNFLSMMRECDADIVFLSDQDDVWHEHKIERVVAEFNSTKSLLLTHDITVTRSNVRDIIVQSYFKALGRSRIAPSFLVKGCALAYRRDLIDIIGWPPKDQSWTHDTWLCLLSSAIGVRDYVRETLILHRIHGGNASGVIFSERSSLKRIVRYFDDRIWPMTEMDRLVANCVDPVGVESFELQMRRLNTVNQVRTRQALNATLRKQRIVKLQRSAAYKNSLTRSIRSILLFAAGNYLSYGNLAGLLADVKGLRPALAVAIHKIVEASQSQIGNIKDA